MKSKAQQTKIGGPCWICGKGFITTRAHQKTCSNAHRQKLSRRGGVAEWDAAVAIANAKRTGEVKKMVETSEDDLQSFLKANRKRRKTGRVIHRRKVRSAR